MWMVGSVTMMSILASVLGADVRLGSDVVEPTGGADGLDPFVSYVQVQEAREPRIWLDRGVDPVLEAGDRVRIYYRTDADAYVAILQIDTDGTTRMLYPRSPSENHYARANRDYRLLFPRSAYWNVDDRPGVGYFFIVTSPTPFDLSDFRYSYYDGGWDLSDVGSTVYSDPYVAIDEYVARLVPDWEYVDYGLDFISYSVGAAHEYPRFLCYQCHGFRPYSTWNPYRYTCVDFRVVVYDDPYFYPSYRYRADRVVMVGPRNPARPRFEFKERAVGDPGTPVTVVRPGRGDDPPSAADRPRTDQRAGGARARVAPPPVAPPPNTTDRRTPSSQDGTPRVRAGGGRVTPPPGGDRVAPPPGDRATPPPTGDREPRRPTLQRRSDTPTQGTRPRPDAVRPRPEQPRPSSQSNRPSTRRPANPPAAPPAAPSARRSSPRPSPPRASPRPSTRRPSPSSGGSSSARPAPRERSRTPPSARGSTGAPQRRPARTGPR